VQISHLAEMADQVQYPDGPSLREQKRAVVRQALSRAALQLALQRGLEHVLVADIAATARVSPRTFNNYFSSKEEAVVAPAFDRMAKVLVAFRERPTSEPLWESATAAIVAQFPPAGPEDGEVVRHVRLISDSPGLWVEQLKVYAAIERLLAGAIAERLDVKDDELFPRLVAAAAISASRVAFEHWLSGDHDEAFPTVLRRALDQLSGAFPAQSGRRVR
jgi:AcrR family transcriptional regulator